MYIRVVQTTVKIVLGTVALMLGLRLVGETVVPAQTGETWSAPINLSQSGATDAPRLVVDSTGVIHVAWLDEFDGLVYTKRTDGDWSPPEVAAIPSEEYSPLLLADSNNDMHAFWVDADGVLFYSWTDANDFVDDGWSNPIELAESVLVFDAAVDAGDFLHVAFIQFSNIENAPSGVYYRQLSNLSIIWTEPVLLYSSPYFRSLTVEDAVVDLTLAESEEGQPTVMVAWDNRPRKKIIMAASPDRGRTWGEPKILVESENSTVSITPHFVDAQLVDQSLLLVWKELGEGTDCTQFYRFFSPEGEALDSAYPMLKELPACPENSKLIPGRGDFTLLQTAVFGEIYMLAWNGAEWSLPQLQQELAAFVDPETSQPITLACLQTYLTQTNELYLVGCDTGEGGDIWFTSREITEIDSWYPHPSAWKTPVTFGVASGIVTSADMVSDEAGNYYALWTSMRHNSPASQGRMDIHYAYSFQGNWSDIRSLEPPFGNARQLSSALDNRGRLFVVWSGGNLGEIYFTWTNTLTADTVIKWAEPVALPVPRAVGSAPDIVIADDGAIFVVYAIPLNENRGIYVIRSNDRGLTWTEPVQVVDATNTQWEILDEPVLAITQNGHLHLLFSQFPPPGIPGDSSIYFTKSMDGGETWQLPELVAEGTITWKEIGGRGHQTVYRLWQEKKNDVTITWLDASSDGGDTWGVQSSFTNPDPKPGPLDLELDRAGYLHLVQISEDDQGLLQLREWTWDGNLWAASLSQTIGEGNLDDAGYELAIEVTLKDELGVLITKPKSDPSEVGIDVIFTTRALELPPQITPTSETNQPTPIPGPTATTSPILDPTPTSTTPPVETTPDALDSTPVDANALDMQIFGPIIGLLAAVLVVIVTFLTIGKLRDRYL